MHVDSLMAYLGRSFDYAAKVVCRKTARKPNPESPRTAGWSRSSRHPMWQITSYTDHPLAALGVCHSSLVSSSAMVKMSSASQRMAASRRGRLVSERHRVLFLGLLDR